LVLYSLAVSIMKHFIIKREPVPNLHSYIHDSVELTLNLKQQLVKTTVPFAGNRSDSSGFFCWIFMYVNRLQ
jgi:hypothetical protein